MFRRAVPAGGPPAAARLRDIGTYGVSPPKDQGAMSKCYSSVCIDVIEKTTARVSGSQPGFHHRLVSGPATEQGVGLQGSRKCQGGQVVCSRTRRSRFERRGGRSGTHKSGVSIWQLAPRYGVHS